MAFVSGLKIDTGISFEKQISLDQLMMLFMFSHRYLPVILINFHDSCNNVECLIAYSIISFSQNHLHFLTAFSWSPLNWSISNFFQNILAISIRVVVSSISYPEFSQKTIYLQSEKQIYLIIFCIYCTYLIEGSVICKKRISLFGCIVHVSNNVSMVSLIG